jgi:hypothetical protein
MAYMLPIATFIFSITSGILSTLQITLFNLNFFRKLFKLPVVENLVIKGDDGYMVRKLTLGEISRNLRALRVDKEAMLLRGM